MARLLVATSNPGKLREVASFLAGFPNLDLVGLGEVANLPDVPEDERTFRGNAVMKAVECGRAAGLLALADDSGLVVDRLAGAPGVLSARFGGPGLDDAGRCRHLLRLLEGVPPESRRARFVCVLALADGGRILETFEGRVEGLILQEPRGTNGFGYDPIFLHPGLGRSFAELSTEEKGSVSHRGRALAKLRDFLKARPDLLI